MCRIDDKIKLKLRQAHHLYSFLHRHYTRHFSALSRITKNASNTHTLITSDAIPSPRPYLRTVWRGYISNFLLIPLMSAHTVRSSGIYNDGAPLVGAKHWQINRTRSSVGSRAKQARQNHKVSLVVKLFQHRIYACSPTRLLFTVPSDSLDKQR